MIIFVDEALEEDGLRDVSGISKGGGGQDIWGTLARIVMELWEKFPRTVVRKKCFLVDIKVTI